MIQVLLPIVMVVVIPARFRTQSYKFREQGILTLLPMPLPSEMRLTGLEAYTMAEVTVVRSDTDELVDVMLPFEAEFPLNRRPKGVRHGSRIGAWYFDRETGILTW